MTICDDSIKANLMEIGSFELQHLMDASSVDSISSSFDFSRSIVATTKCSVDQLLAEFVEQIERWEVSTARDLDELRETVTDLRHRQGSQEAEIQESVDRCVVSTQTVLIVAIVDSNLDRHRCIDQADNSGRDTDIVGVASICSTGKTV